MENKRIYYVGIDHGNHLMKSANHVFENGVERLATKPTFSGNTLIHEGVFYKIGEKRNSVKDSKMADDDYYLLTLVALAKECQSGAIPNGARVVLGVGLPLKHFATTRKAFVRVCVSWLLEPRWMKFWKRLKKVDYLLFVGLQGKRQSYCNFSWMIILTICSFTMRYVRRVA